MVQDKAGGVPVQAVLHVGGPKCGSSALQRALSLSPILSGGDGRPYRYQAGRLAGGRLVPVEGRLLATMTHRSVHGYLSWPNVTRQEDPAPYWQSVAAAISAAKRRGQVPILSSEGWIAHAPAAEGVMVQAGLDVLDVVAFVRPPLDWLNAAYWQWIVWGVPSYSMHQHIRRIDLWLSRSRYEMGSQLAAWAAVPGVRLRVDSAAKDVVASFARGSGVSLQAGEWVNPAPPAALTGFVLRNRRFRSSPHDSTLDFVVQRWCCFPKGEKLWAFLPVHAREVWPRLMEEAERLLEVLPPETAEQLLAEPGWRTLDPYWKRLKAGPTRLDDLSALSDLYDGIAAGVQKACSAVRWRPETQDDKPSARSEVESWDAAIARQLDVLLEADARWRRYAALRLRVLGSVPDIGRPSA